MQQPRHMTNTRAANPNPFITFIRALEKKKDSRDAEDILRAVAAQMKRIMEQRYMLVGTLEEAAYNSVFAGRNWNYGQTIELVLRGPRGRFYPMSYIIDTMCHEMAHITHMNHGPEFQKLNKAIKADVAKMQSQGNYGDGFWSDGRRLRDSARVGADGVRPSDFPEYICGVTASDAKRGRRRRGGTRPQSSRGPGLVKGEASHLSGRQTEYRRKAGTRTAVDMGESLGRLDGRRVITAEDRAARKTWIDKMVVELERSGTPLAKAKRQAASMYDRENPWFKEGSTAGKQAKSKTAAEVRAAAAERRLGLLARKEEVKEEEEEVVKREEEAKPQVSGSESDDDVVEIEDPHLSIEDRKREMEAEMTQEERASLSGGWQQPVADGGAPSGSTSRNSRRSGSGSRSPAVPLESEDEVVFVGAVPGPSKREREDDEHTPVADAKRPTTSSRPTFSQTGLVRQERARALGLAPTMPGTSGGRTIGSGPPTGGSGERTGNFTSGGSEWHCSRCTFSNRPSADSCDMCQAPRAMGRFHKAWDDPIP